MTSYSTVAAMETNGTYKIVRASPTSSTSSPSSSSSASSSSYVLHELQRVAAVVSKPDSVSSFQQLRHTLGDDAAFVVMDYFVDVRALHDQCIELQSYSADRHAAVLKALLLRSETLRSITATPSPAGAQAQQLIDAVGCVSAVASLSALVTPWEHRGTAVAIDCLAQAVIQQGRTPLRFQLPFDADNIRSFLPPTLRYSPSKKEVDQMGPSAPVKLAMFEMMACAYYEIWELPHSVVQRIDLHALFEQARRLPPSLRVPLSAHNRKLLAEAGFE